MVLQVRAGGMAGEHGHASSRDSSKETRPQLRSTLLDEAEGSPRGPEYASQSSRRESRKVMSLAALQRRAQYMSSSTLDLRKQCEERGILSEEVDSPTNRWNIIKTLEADDENSNLVGGNWFESFFLGVVLVNGFTIAVQIDNPGIFSSSFWLSINFTFFLLFTVEFAMKVYILGWHKYIKDPWNQFDLTVLVLVGLQMSAMYSLTSASIYDEVSKIVPSDFVQILRLARLFRLARYFTELGMLIESFVSSMKALFWILMLLLIWFYMTACVATVFIGRRALLPSENEEEIGELRAKFDTIPLSMFALFEIMTLEGWVDYVRPLLHTRLYLVFFFLGFIFITAFFMLNLITAVVVDRTLAAQESANASETKEKELQRASTVRYLCELLEHENIDAAEGHPDVISEFRFKIALDNQKVQKIIRELGFSKAYMISMFHLADVDTTQGISISNLQKLLEVSNQALDTASYVRFQVNLAERLEVQEKLMMTVLESVKIIGQGKIDFPPALQARMEDRSLLHAGLEVGRHLTPVHSMR